MNWRSETAKQPSIVTKELFLLWVRSTHKGECGMYWYVITLITCCKRQINRSWMAPSLISGHSTVNLCPFSACSSWPDHRGVKFKLLLQPANSIRSGKDAQCCKILAPFLVRGEGLPFAAHTAGVITLVYHHSPCLLHPTAIVMPDRVAVLSISAPRGQAIRSKIPKRQAVWKLLNGHLYCFQFGQSVILRVWLSSMQYHFHT